jgi:hypothetical protein
MGYAATQGILAVFATVIAIKNFDLPWFEVRRALGTLLHDASVPNSLESSSLQDRF